ncbi:MAG TPA: hypothetical protein VD993_05650 [Chitinophagaceae bacterium]|nr:hypothetical protein [Chitinophagaceae bacterium]
MKNPSKRHAPPRTAYLLMICVFAAITGCEIKDKPSGQPAVASVPVQNAARTDTVILKEARNEEDYPQEYLADKLKPIRTNFKRINSISTWAFIDTIELQESAEGGEAVYYYQDGKLQKIITRHFGETSQRLAEYYLLDDRISFVLEKSYAYSRPVYHDSTAMKENNDTATSDMDKSEIIEARNYFQNGKLLHQIHSQDCGAPWADEYLREEQSRIVPEFERLLKLAKRK